MRDLMAERRTQAIAVVREELGIMSSARNSYIGHAIVEQVPGPEFLVSGNSKKQNAQLNRLSLAALQRQKPTDLSNSWLIPGEKFGLNLAFEFA